MNFEACNHLVEQMLPVNGWKTEFYTVPLATRNIKKGEGDTYRILASQDNTEIRVNGVLVNTLNRGQFHEMFIKTSSLISGSQPIQVAQYSNGQEYDDTTGDPFMLLLASSEQYSKSYLFSTPVDQNSSQDNFNDHYINITIPTSDTSNFTIDGMAPPPANIVLAFKQIPGSLYSAGTFKINSGTHTVAATAKFGLSVYGYATTDGYGFNGGAKFEPSYYVRNYEYDTKFNKVTKVTDENGKVSLFDIDPSNGNLRSSTIVVGAPGGDDDLVSRYTYTAKGQIDTLANPRGFITDYDYDALGRLINVTYAKGTSDEAIERMDYYANGTVQYLIDANGNRTDYEYDSMNRPRFVTGPDPDGSGGPLGRPVTEYRYDPAGNLEFVIDPGQQGSSRNTQTKYDKIGRVSEIIDASGQTTSYKFDNVGNIKSVTDPLGNVTTYNYDKRNRRVETIDSLNGSTKFEYDLDGNLTALTDPIGNVTRFEYDFRSRLVRETDPLGKVSTYVYDGSNNLMRKADRNGVATSFVYDDAYRLTKESWSAIANAPANTVNFSYDQNSNLVSIADSYSKYTYGYDALNRVSTADNTGTPKAPRLKLAYTYDDLGLVKSVVEAVNGNTRATSTYDYNPGNQLSSIRQSGGGASNKRVDFTYNILGQFATISRYAGLTNSSPVANTVFDYDSLSRLDKITHSNGSGSQLAYFDLGYDKSSRITSIADRDGTSTYGYDKTSQVTSADYSDSRKDESYSFDANGNRITSSQHGNGYDTPANSANRLRTDGKYNYTYDFEGNMASRTEIATGTVRTFAWDQRNRLVGITDKNTSGQSILTAEFTYDAFNRRIAKAVDTNPGDAVAAAIEHYLYDREDIILDFLDADGAGSGLPTEAKRYLHGPGADMILAQENAGGETQWLLTDHLGTTRDIVNNSGSVVNHLQYDTFGNVTSETGAGQSSRYLYTGREYDNATGLHYYRARYYDASIGKFISEDPIGFGGGDYSLNRYVGNKVVFNLDPSGLDSEKLKDVANEVSGEILSEAFAPNAPGLSSGVSWGLIPVKVILKEIGYNEVADGIGRVQTGITCGSAVVMWEYGVATAPLTEGASLLPFLVTAGLCNWELYMLRNELSEESESCESDLATSSEYRPSRFPRITPFPALNQRPSTPYNPSGAIQNLLNHPALQPIKRETPTSRRPIGNLEKF
jgi:RHS repeat-associated protein